MNQSLAWSDEQWAKVRAAVHDSAMNARCAGSFLPLYGPLSDDVQSVPRQRLDLHELDYGGATALGLAVDDVDTLRFCTAAINLRLGSAQVSDPDLESALLMFRRAADIVARVEDAIVFNGQPARDSVPDQGLRGVPPIYTLSGGQTNAGLLTAGEHSVAIAKPKSGGSGEGVFAAVVEGITRLESSGHFGPFACVLGESLFLAVNTPLPNSMVLPRDSILPFLNGPMLRSSAVPADRGVLVSLQNAPVEIVVPSDISARYLQMTPDAKHLFRVSQRFVLRVKEPGAIVTLGA